MVPAPPFDVGRADKQFLRLGAPMPLGGHRLTQLVRQSRPIMDRTFTFQFLAADVQATAFTFG